MSTMTSERRDELIQTCNRVATGEEPDDTAALASVVREILRALPVTDEREETAIRPDDATPKDRETTVFPPTPAPVEGDEVCREAAIRRYRKAKRGLPDKQEDDTPPG